MFHRFLQGIDVSYGLDEFEKDEVAEWDGVRNYAVSSPGHVMQESHGAVEAEGFA